MAKCSICNSRKGKRKCSSTNTFICSLCCGETRCSEKCVGCSYYKDGAEDRRYSKVPYFPLKEMSNDFNLQNIAEGIEKCLCEIDNENNINDAVATRIVELLLDKYFFNDEKLFFNSPLEEMGFSYIDKHMKRNLKDISTEEVNRVLATILRSIKRHNNGARGYLHFAHQFVGA